MKKSLILLSTIAFILLIGFLSIDFFVTRIIDHKVKEIQKDLVGTFNFEYSSLKVSILEKRIELKNFRLESALDTSQSINSIEFELAKLIIVVDSYKDVLFEGKLHIQELILKKPIISYGIRNILPEVEVNEDSFNEEEFKEEMNEEKPNENRLISLIIIDNVSVLDGEATIYSQDKINNNLLYINNLGIESNAISIDLNETSLDRMFHNEELNVQIRDLTSDEIKNLRLEIKKIDFSKTSQSLEISGIHLQNTEKIKEFTSKQKFRALWMDIVVDKIKLKVRPRQIYNRGIIYLKKIEIDGAHVELYNDLTLTLKPGHKAMPPSDLRNVPLPFKIDSIILKNSELSYFHKAKAEAPGLLQFKELDAIVTRATNINYLIEQNSRMNIDINAKLWGKGDFKGNFSLDLENPLDIVYAKGTLKNLPINEVEKMIKPLYGVEISSGNIDVLRFDFIMNENIGKGVLQFDYSDLKVDIKKNKEDEYGEQKSNKFFNFIANEAVISSNIPGSKKYESEGYIIFERNKEKPIFDLLWNCLQVGIMDIVIPDAIYSSKSNYNKKEKKEEKELKKEKAKKK